MSHWRQNISKSGTAEWRHYYNESLNTSKIELISIKLVSVYQMSKLEPENLGFNEEYPIK